MLDAPVAGTAGSPGNSPTRGAANEPNEGGTAPSFLALSGLTKRFGKATVVNDVSLDVARSEFVCILGPSGCGKTTLLRLIAGFESADAGQIVQAGRDITRLPPEARDFGIVFQSYALFPNRTVAGNIAFGLESVGTARASRTSRVDELMALVGLAEHSAKYPSQLSGGQQQRVALARALALSPGLLLLDEPLSALDANVRSHLRDELRSLQRRVGVTTVMVTHDQHEALSIADRLIVMNKGRIEQSGSPEDVYGRPANLFVARFLGSMNAWPIDAVEGPEIRCGGLTLRLDHPLADLPTGAHFCIRPAAVALGRDAEGAGNEITVRVTSATFLGDMIRIRTEQVGASGLALDIDVARTRLSAVPQGGDTLQVALPAHHCSVLGRGP